MSRSSGAAAAVEEFVRGLVRDGTCPGAAYLVAERDRVLLQGAIGASVVEPETLPAATTTLYDLASLTKPLATALLAVRLQAEGRLRLDDRLDRHLPEWRAGDARSSVTLLDLLTHRSGLPSWDPLYAHASDVAGRIERLRSIPLAHPPLLDVTYSCLDYILIGFVLERAGGAPLDRLFRDRVAGPLGGLEILLAPPADLRRRIAATERGNEREKVLAGAAGAGYNGWRRGIIWGEVHDNNAFTLGGVAGNAGLFGTAAAVHAVAREFLPGGRGLLGAEERALFAHNFTRGLGQHRAVGFQLGSSPGSSAGDGLSPRSFGHTGFTGTSVWIDPESLRICVLLTNRVHPVFHDLDMNEVRRRFHALAASV
ncbi:MAG TPA: serine hydrolase [Candidatus Cryosericum sp.]|nr:serine hydrolase [Candidatus Cryosericum sp.]